MLFINHLEEVIFPLISKIKVSLAGDICCPNSVLLLLTKSLVVSDTLVKLMEYGEDDDDLEETGKESLASDSSFSLNSDKVNVRKPFWAL